MKKISIIIPLYNLEGLIGKCIASALDQDLPPEEYEVIVVDDGSTDGSLAAAQRAACGHANVQVHAKPNEGVSLARNYGTERAAGRYVMYVDADDYLSPGVLGGLTQIMDRERLDMLCFDMAGVDEHGGDLPLWSDGLFARGGGEVQSGRDFLRCSNGMDSACSRCGTRTKSSPRAPFTSQNGSDMSRSGCTTTCNTTDRSWEATIRSTARTLSGR